MKVYNHNYLTAHLNTPVKVSSQNVMPLNLDSQNKQTIWQDLGQRYNVRNATFPELCAISLELYSTGNISLIDHAMMTFNFEKAALDLRQTQPQALSDFNLTPVDDYGKRDWIKEFELRANRDFKQNNMKSYIQNQKLAQILRQI